MRACALSSNGPGRIKLYLSRLTICVKAAALTSKMSSSIVPLKCTIFLCRRSKVVSASVMM